LALFRPAVRKDDEALAIFAEVNPVARTKINSVLVNTSPNALGVGKIPVLLAALLVRAFKTSEMGGRPSLTLAI
jgi:hypothetical protein